MGCVVVASCRSVSFVWFVPIVMVFLIAIVYSTSGAHDRMTDCLLLDEGGGGSYGFGDVTISTGPSLSLSSLGEFYDPVLAFGWEDKKGGGGGQRQAMQARQVGPIGNALLNKNILKK